MIVNLFYEASTRTRTSFEIAAKRLGADAVSITASGSSVSKGESLVDTLNTLAAMRPDAIVMRHAASGAPHFLARHLPTPIINAGDGTHEHPTQALLDARTILDRRAALEGLKVAIIGDIAHSRVARSNVHLLAKFGSRSCSADRPRCCRAELAQLAPGVSLTTDIREAIRDADVIMMLRVQLERQHEAPFPASEYFRFYGLRLEHLDLARPDAIVMHPGPINRGRELSSRGGRLPALGDSQPGGKRHRGAHGGAGKGDWIAHADCDPQRPRDRPGLETDRVADVLIADGRIVGVAPNLSGPLVKCSMPPG